MPFEKGHTKISGRQKGTPNRTTLIKSDDLLIDLNINPITKLGEGSYWCDPHDSLYWLDINNSTLFRGLNDKASCYQLMNNISTVLDVKGNLVYLTDRSGVISFCLDSLEIQQISTTPAPYVSKTYRANDGVKLSDQLYMYGVMRDKPIKNDGALILSRDRISKVVYTGIAIPNTFVKIPNSNSLLITDSFEGIVYKIDFNDSWESVQSKVKWLDLSHTNTTPDGGCISSDGRVFLAIWDGFKILELDLDGKLMNEFKVPIPRPTNCTLNTKEDQLFVTSAYEGLSDLDRNKYPLSGSILTIDINIQNVSKYY